MAVVTTHPVQYYAPLFRRLAERGRVEPHVFYGWTGAAGRAAHDRGFGEAFAWDVPLLDGYAHTFLRNVSEDPGTHHFRGIDTPGLVPAVRAWEPDAVLVFGWNYRGHLRALRAFHGGVPVLFRGDSTLLDEGGGVKGRLRTLARRAALRWVYDHVDLALYVGAHNRDYFRAHGLSDRQLAWAPHAVDNGRFADADGEREAEAQAWQRSLGVPEGGRVVVFAGKLEPKKAPDVLLDAFLTLEGVPNAHLAFCGSGPLEGALRQRAAGRPDVHFLGFQNQSRMPTVYRLGHALALPSRGPGETWGLAVNEAMASGRAVVVSDRVGCAPDLVGPDNGRTVPTGSASALAGALADVLQNGVAERMGRASLARIGDWSIEAAAERVEEGVRSLAHG